MDVLITLAGVDYDSEARAEMGLEINVLRRTLEGYDELAFARHGGHPTPEWVVGDTVKLYLDEVLWFDGLVTHVIHNQDHFGWSIGWNSQGKKYVLDRVAFTAADGTGTYAYNRSPEDLYYVDAEAGLTLGQILQLILMIPANAQALAAAGMAYDDLIPPTLPAATLADLALLTVVPPRPVYVTGANLLNWIDQQIQRWMPMWVVDLRPDGTLRVRDTHDLTQFVPRTIMLPGPTGIGDDVEWPNFNRQGAGGTQSYTRMVLRGGPDVALAWLSQREGTLDPEWTSGEESSWTLHDFTDPQGSTSTGNVSSVTGNSVTFDPDDGAATWPANFWSGRQAHITLINPLATGLAIYETRRVTSNTACAALGSCTITWDSTLPVSTFSFTRAQLIGGAGGNNDVARLYAPFEPATSARALDTYVGAHLVVRNPKPLKFSNNQQALDVYYTIATVWNSASGPSIPWNVSVIPSTGQFKFSQPTVSAFGNPSTLNTGFPTTTANGLPWDVQVIAMYSRGPLSITIPPDISGVPQYEGSAYAQDGIELTRYEDIPEWTTSTAQPDMQLLAQKLLDSYSDTVVEGSFQHYDIPSWDFLTFGTAVNFDIAGGTSPWLHINAPIKEVELEWANSAVGYQFKVHFHFSTRRQAFTGRDMYIHPAFSGGSVLGDLLKGKGLSLEQVGLNLPGLHAGEGWAAMAATVGKLVGAGWTGVAGGEDINGMLGGLGTGADIMGRLPQTGQDVAGMQQAALAQTGQGQFLAGLGMGGGGGAGGAGGGMPGIPSEAQFAIAMAAGHIPKGAERKEVEERRAERRKAHQERKDAREDAQDARDNARHEAALQRKHHTAERNEAAVARVSGPTESQFQQQRKQEDEKKQNQVQDRANEEDQRESARRLAERKDAERATKLNKTLGDGPLQGGGTWPPPPEAPEEKPPTVNMPKTPTTEPND